MVEFGEIRCLGPVGINGNYATKWLRVAGTGLRSPFKSDYEPDEILTSPPQML